jgi:hypothetical protein
MTIDQIVADSAFSRLSDGQKLFVRTLLANGRDKMAAAKSAWVPKDNISAESMANRALRNPVISRLVNDYFGTTAEEQLPSREDFQQLLWRKAQTAKSDGDTLKYLALYARVSGLEFRPAEAAPITPTQQENIDDILTEIERRGT